MKQTDVNALVHEYEESKKRQKLCNLSNEKWWKKGSVFEAMSMVDDEVAVEKEEVAVEKAPHFEQALCRNDPDEWEIQAKELELLNNNAPPEPVLNRNY